MRVAIRAPRCRGPCGPAWLGGLGWWNWWCGTHRRTRGDPGVHLGFATRHAGAMQLHGAGEVSGLDLGVDGASAKARHEAHIVNT